jgi:ferredoxin
MKVRVNEELCIGDEAYVEVCPEIFEMRGDVAVAKMEEVPEELEQCCGNAAASCPIEAIQIEE